MRAVPGGAGPDQIPNLDNIADGRPKLPARIGLWTLWVLEATSIVGAVALRRRRVPISPLVALVITVTITTAITFGETRYRATAEPALVLLAVAGMGWSWQQVRRRDPASPRCAGEPVPPVPSVPSVPSVPAVPSAPQTPVREREVVAAPGCPIAERVHQPPDPGGCLTLCRACSYACSANGGCGVSDGAGPLDSSSVLAWPRAVLAVPCGRFDRPSRVWFFCPLGAYTVVVFA